MAGIFDRGPSAILGELLGGAFGVNQAQSQPGSIEEFMRVMNGEPAKIIISRSEV